MKKVYKKKAPARKRAGAAKAQYKRRAAAPKRRAVRPAPSRTIAGRSGQVSHSGTTHYLRAGAISKHQKMLVPDSVMSISGAATYECMSGLQTHWSLPNIENANLRTMLNYVKNAQVAGTGARGPVRAVVRGSLEEYLLSNSTNASCEVDIYDLKVSRDILNTMQFVANTFTYNVGFVADDYIQQGLLAQQGYDPASPPTIFPGQLLSALPTDSRLFRDYFKIVKKTRVFMSPGATHKHTVKVGVNRFIDELLANNSIRCTKGFATQTMFVVRGMPVSIDTEPPVDPLVAATTSSNRILLVRSQRLKYSWVADTSYSSVFSTALAQIPANNQLFINPLTGAEDSVVGTPVLV